MYTQGRLLRYRGVSENDFLLLSPWRSEKTTKKHTSLTRGAMQQNKTTHLSHADSNRTAPASVAGLVPVPAMKLSSRSDVVLAVPILRFGAGHTVVAGGGIADSSRTIYDMDIFGHLILEHQCREIVHDMIFEPLLLPVCFNND